MFFGLTILKRQKSRMCRVPSSRQKKIMLNLPFEKFPAHVRFCRRAKFHVKMYRLNYALSWHVTVGGASFQP